MTDETTEENREWAIEWTVFRGVERWTVATEAEAREQAPSYGPQAYVARWHPLLQTWVRA